MERVVQTKLSGAVRGALLILALAAQMLLVPFACYAIWLADDGPAKQERELARRTHQQAEAAQRRFEADQAREAARQEQARQNREAAEARSRRQQLRRQDVARDRALRAEEYRLARASDSSPANAPSSPANAPVDKAIAGLRFDGKNDCVVAEGVSWEGGPLTMEAWLTSHADNRLTPIVEIGGPGRRLATLSIKFKSPQFATGDAEQAHSWEPDPTYKLEVNHRVHLAACWDGDALRMFVDGRAVPCKKRSIGRVMVNPETTMAIGRWQWNEKGPFFVGDIDELHVTRSARYDVDFTPAETLTADEHTLLLYHFDEGREATLRDASGNGHDGTIVGATWSDGQE